MKHALLIIPLALATLAAGCKKKVTQKPALTISVYSIHSSNSLDSGYIANTSSFRITCDSLGYEECRSVSGNGTFFFERLRPGGYHIEDYYNRDQTILIVPESDEQVTLMVP